MADLLKVNGTEVSAAESKVLEDLLRRLPAVHNGDRNISEQEAVRLLNIVGDEKVDACDLYVINKPYEAGKELKVEDFQRAYQVLSRHLKAVKSLQLGSFDLGMCKNALKLADSNWKRIDDGSVGIILNGYTTQIDDEPLKVVANAVKEINPAFTEPLQEVSFSWHTGLDLPATNPGRNQFYSGILNHGLKAAKAAVWYKLARHIAKETQEHSLSYRMEKKSEEKKFDDVWMKLCEAYLKIEKQGVALKALDFAALMPEAVKHWGLTHRMKVMTDTENGAGHARGRVEIFDLFASVAVMVRFFPAELKKRIEGITDPTQREAARQFAQTVAQKFKVAF